MIRPFPKAIYLFPFDPTFGIISEKTLLYSGVRQFVAFFPLTHFFQKIIKYKITGL
jgi:hypothetical protein